MTVSASKFLVPVALCATGLGVLLVAGCEKKPPEPDRASPESYMNDKTFRSKLSEQRKERQRLLTSRSEIVCAMKAMIDAKKREMKTDDLSKVKAVLDKDPAWQALYKQCEEANAKVEAHRKAQQETVRERLTPVKGEKK